MVCAVTGEQQAIWRGHTDWLPARPGGVVWLATFYIAGSIPLHVQAFFTHWTGYISWFPMWFSIVLMPVYVGIILLMWRLRYRQ